MQEVKITKVLCLICQRYNLKANHNIYDAIVNNGTAVFNMSKIQSESKSQHLKTYSFFISAVFNMSKIQSESKSQLWGLPAKHALSCV